MRSPDFYSEQKGKNGNPDLWGEREFLSNKKLISRAILLLKAGFPSCLNSILNFWKSCRESGKSP
jgi:hypothetical protein